MITDMPRLTLKHSRERLAWTQKRLAAESGEKQSAIFDIETGRSKDPAFTRAMRIVKAMKCAGLKIDAEDIFPVPDPPACLKRGPNGNGRKKAA